MPRPRTPARISETLHQRLNAYALAASAAGVGMLALTPPAEYLLAAGAAVAGLFTFPEPAEARIVYTPARKNIVCHGTDGGCHGTINLNLNHGRGADFRLLCSSTPYARGLWVTLVNSKNRVWTTPGYQRGAAAALSSGALIQSGSKFRATQLNMIWSSTNSEGVSWAVGVR